MSGLQEGDANAAARAVKLLSLAGYNVDQIGKVSEAGEVGVSFTLDVSAPTRYGWFWDQLEAVDEAAVEAEDQHERGGL